MLFPAKTIGIYGVSGSGKSRALSELQKKRPEWRYLEGSSLIEQVLRKRGMEFDDFKAMDDVAKTEARDAAISILEDSPVGLTVVAGHASFPGESNDKSLTTFHDVFTAGDARIYNAVLYLDVAPEKVYDQQESDNSSGRRHRKSLPVERISKWIEHEKDYLQQVCREHGIHFALVRDENDMLNHIMNHIVAPMVVESEKMSQLELRSAINSIPSADVYLVFDGDRTLSPHDTSDFFFDAIDAKAISPFNTNGDAVSLKKIFQRYPNYNFQAFLEVAMLYGRLMPSAEYKELSQEIGATKVKLYPAWIDFLSNIPPSKVHPILVSSGNREIWSAALEQNLSTTSMSIIAGNHIGLHPYVVDSNAKEIVVTELRRHQPGCKIIAFGDSLIDVPMLESSDRGYIVVDDRGNRSMNFFLQKAIMKNGKIQQLNLNDGQNKIWHPEIPVGCLRCLLQDLKNGNIHQVVDCAKLYSSSSVLATQTRRADLSGPELQRHHVRVGQFLAEKLMDIFPHHFVLRNEKFPHVQGGSFEGSFPMGDNLVIMPLMRAGEPMSRGVYECFPRAEFVHYDNETESHQHLSKVLSNQKVSNVVVVASVVNEGGTVRKVIGHIRKIIGNGNHPQIYVLAGVMQEIASLRLPKEFPRVRFLALRVSKNKYKGQHFC